MFRDGRVLCMLPVNKDHILLGTQAGKIWVFNAITSELEHSSRQLQDSVLSLYLVQRWVYMAIGAFYVKYVATFTWALVGITTYYVKYVSTLW